MIGYLEGALRHKTPDYIIIDAHGVGYQVHIPLSTFYELPEPGNTVALNIHTYVREDTLQLYGFRTTAEKEMFLHLIAVNGVGPRLAVGILSRISSDELTRVVYQNDPARLRKIPGVGKKIADRLLLELRDRLKVKGGRDEQIPVVFQKAGAYEDAFSALVNLGYRPAEVENMLKGALREVGEDASLERLLKVALKTTG